MPDRPFMMDLRRMLVRTLIAPICLCFLPLPTVAQDIAWPDGAEMVEQVPPALGALRLATGPFASGALPSRQVDGLVSEQVWQLPGVAEDLGPQLAGLRAQIEAQGYDVFFSCADRRCGGFDFRYALPVAEGPAMHVDLGNFYYLAAHRDTADGGAYLALMLSHGGQMGYAHLARVAPPGSVPATVTTSTRQPAADRSDGDLIDNLLTDGKVVLDDLAFDIGASTLSAGSYDSLGRLGTFLVENPDRRILLVGHTDAEGGLDSNIALSEARAGAVRQVLIEQFGVDPSQLQAEGVGYLAPLASNSDPDGRQANRRVEAVLADM